MLTASQPHTRVKQREFSTSKAVSMEDIRLCQQAFSGKWPGSAVHEPGGRSKVGHVTVNDVMCAVMADVCGEELGRRTGQETGLWARMKGVLRRVLPTPIGFFMYVTFVACIWERSLTK